MKSIYDMMGNYTYPSMQEDAPREHVESFFQVKLLSKLMTMCHSYNQPYSNMTLWYFFQKMDRNKDGVVTIEEFIESCKKV